VKSEEAERALADAPWCEGAEWEVEGMKSG